jgi:hypothetical protein
MLNKLLLMITSVLTLLMPVKGMLLLCFALVLIDTAFAVYTTINLNGRKSFRSVLLRRGLTRKIFYYFTSIIIMYSIDKLIFGGILFGIHMLLAKSITMLFVYTEVKSCDENSQLLGNRPFVVVAKEALGFFKAVKTEVEGLKKQK